LRKLLPGVVVGLVLIDVTLGRVIGCLGIADALNAVKRK